MRKLTITALVATMVLIGTANADVWVNVKAGYMGTDGEPTDPAKDFDIWISPPDEATGTMSSSYTEYEDKGTEMVPWSTGGSVSARHHRFHGGDGVQPGHNGYGCVKLPTTASAVDVLRTWWTDGNGVRIPNTRAWGMSVEFTEGSDWTMFVSNRSVFAVDIVNVLYGDAVSEPNLALLDPDAYAPPGGWNAAGSIIGLAGWGGDEEAMMSGPGGTSAVPLLGSELYACPVVMFDVIHNASATPVGRIIMATPEPATLSLLALGGLMLIRRRRR